MKKRPLHRWLSSTGACFAARRWFRDYRTFDEAWKGLNVGIWIWWLGDELLNLGFDWDEKYTSLNRDFNSFDCPKVRQAMKRHIRGRVKAHYKAFLQRERRA